MLMLALQNEHVNVAEAWETATRLAANTATTWMLQQTGVRTEDLAAEIERHNQLLAAQGGAR